jgi:hypothetical protein
MQHIDVRSLIYRVCRHCITNESLVMTWYFLFIRSREKHLYKGTIASRPEVETSRPVVSHKRFNDLRLIRSLISVLFFKAGLRDAAVKAHRKCCCPKVVFHIKESFTREAIISGLFTKMKIWNFKTRLELWSAHHSRRLGT